MERKTSCRWAAVYTYLSHAAHHNVVFWHETKVRGSIRTGNTPCLDRIGKLEHHIYLPSRFLAGVCDPQFVFLFVLEISAPIVREFIRRPVVRCKGNHNSGWA